jgi:hypothetical protein
MTAYMTIDLHSLIIKASGQNMGFGCVQSNGVQLNIGNTATAANLSYRIQGR